MTRKSICRTWWSRGTFSVREIIQRFKKKNRETQSSNFSLREQENYGFVILQRVALFVCCVCVCLAFGLWQWRFVLLYVIWWESWETWLDSGGKDKERNMGILYLSLQISQIKFTNNTSKKNRMLITNLTYFQKWIFLGFWP